MFFFKDLFIGPQEFVVGYSNAPEQPQSNARPICHSHAKTSTGHEPATICTAAHVYWSSLRTVPRETTYLLIFYFFKFILFFVCFLNTCIRLFID